MKQIEFDFNVKRQKTFTLADVEIDNGIELNVTFIDKQKELNKALQWLHVAPPVIGVDIETRGLDPHQHDLIMLQFGDEHRQFVIDTRVVDVASIIPYLVNDYTTLVGQNLKFEYKFLKHNYNVCLQKIKDTMIQEKILYNGNGLRNSLKDLAERYLNYTPNKAIRMRFLTIEDKPFSKDEIIYGAYDVILPILIIKQQQLIIEEHDKQILIDLEHEMVKVLGDVEYKGLFFNTDKWMSLYESNLKIYKEKQKPLDNFIISNNIREFIKTQYDMFNSTTCASIMWTSSKQVIKLFNKWNLCPKERSKHTKKLEYTVEAKVLKTSLLTINKNALPEHRELIKNYISFKEYEQRVTTFGVNFITKYVNPITKRLHSNYNQIVNTGRMSSSGPNLQNIPSPKEFRACFTAPVGHKIVNSDFSGQETVILANKSLEPSMIKLLNNGGDMHSFVARYVFPELKELTDEDIKTNHKGKRGISKGAGFAIQYGGTGFTISKNIGLTEAEGDNVYNAYFKAFPEIKKYFAKVIKETLDRGYILINSISNRTFLLKDFKKMQAYSKIPSKKKEYFKLKAKISRLSLNMPVQGTAADITKSASVRFRQWLIDNSLHNKVFITNIVHDEINVETPDSLTEKTAKGLEKCMVAAGKPWCKTIELKAEAVIGDYWAH